MITITHVTLTPEHHDEYQDRVNQHAEAAERTQRAWDRMCFYECVPTTSTFVVFSDDNPYRTEYQEEVAYLQEAALRLNEFLYEVHRV